MDRRRPTPGTGLQHADTKTAEEILGGSNVPEPSVLIPPPYRKLCKGSRNDRLSASGTSLPAVVWCDTRASGCTSRRSSAAAIASHQLGRGHWGVSSERGR